MQCRLCWFRRKSSSTSYAFDQLSEFSSFFFFADSLFKSQIPARSERLWGEGQRSSVLSLHSVINYPWTSPRHWMGNRKVLSEIFPLPGFMKKKIYINVWQKYDKCTHMLHYFSKRRASPWFHSWEKTALTFYWIELHVLWADKKLTRRWKAKTKVATFHLRH